MNGVDWNAVKTELRPKAVAAKNDDELRRVIREMLGRLGQSHFALIPASADSSTGGKSDLTADPGFDIRLVDRTLVVTRLTPGGAAAGAGVKLGWVVDAIDGKSVSSAFAGLPDAMPRRLFDVETWRRVESRLRGPGGTDVKVTFRDGADKAVTAPLARQREQGQPAKVGNSADDVRPGRSESRRTPAGQSAGVIGFNVWMAAVDALFQKAVDEHPKPPTASSSTCGATRAASRR